MSQKVEKVHNFLDPPPGCFGLFWIWEKFEVWQQQPPIGPNLGKIWNWENFESSEPPLKYGTWA